VTKPAAISLVLCDNIYRDSSGKIALIGLFNAIKGVHFPLRQPKLSVYVSATEAYPETRFKIDIVHSEDDSKVVVQLNGPPPLQTTPLTVCDFNFELRNLVFPEPGLYFVRFWGNDYLMLQRPFHVIQLPAETANKES
jgi:hypothetical protein